MEGMVYLTEAQRREMIQHALEGNPNEVCGMLGGQQGRVERVYRAQNIKESPVLYELDPKDHLRIIRDLDRNDLELIGIYHSHTHTEAYPSATDIRLAYYPDAFYFLVSLKDDPPVVRAFRIQKTDPMDEHGTVLEEPIILLDSPAGQGTS